MSREYLSLIREVVLKYWDPIGVGENPMLRDEYDRYLMGIAKLLKSETTTNDLMTDHLLRLEREEMGLRGDPPKSRVAARELMKLVEATED